MPRERPILMAGAMVRALLDGRKTQTRRVVKYIPALGEADAWCGHVQDIGRLIGDFKQFSPHGVRGERLWVREAWAADRCYDHLRPSELFPNTPILFAADDGKVARGWHKVRSARFLPKRFARITLEITDVRVHRLQRISEEDARAEGVRRYTEPCDHSRRTCEDVGCIGPTFRAAFADFWDSIYGKFAWAENPWVWAITFKVAEP